MAWEEDFLYPLILLLITVGLSGGIVTWLTHWLENRRRTQQNIVEDGRKKRDNELEDRRQKQQNDLEDLRKKRDNELEDLRKDREISVERNRKELEIKVDMVSKMAEANANQITNAVITTLLRKKKFTNDEKNAFYENFRKWYVDVSTIHSKLDSYFPGTGLSERWRDYIDSVQSCIFGLRQYFLDPRSDDENVDLKNNLDNLRKYVSDDNKADWDRLTSQTDRDSKQWELISKKLGVEGDELLRDVLKTPVKVF